MGSYLLGSTVVEQLIGISDESLLTVELIQVILSFLPGSMEFLSFIHQFIYLLLNLYTNKINLSRHEEREIWVCEQ